MENSQPKCILILDNDVVVDPNLLHELVRVAESDKRIGVVGPKIYYYDYKGRNDVIWSAGDNTRWWFPNITHQMGKNDNDLPKYQTVTSVDWITGAVLMFKSCLTEKVGLLDPWYFFGYEDIDYCLKVRRHGFKIVYVPTAKAWHKVGASAKEVHMTTANLSAYCYLIKQDFLLFLYIYSLLMLPALLFRWGLLYLIRVRDRRKLRRFLSDLAKFIPPRRKQNPQAGCNQDLASQR